MKRGTGACKIQLCDDTEQDYFTNKGTLLPTIHTIHQQAAEYYNGKTYVAFQGPNHDIYIKAYDHSNENWSDIVYVADNPLATDDSHGAPSLVIDDLGYLHIFYGAHTAALKYVKSTNPEDIYSWTAMTDPTTHATYPQAFAYYWNSSCWIYLFYRGSTNGDGGHGDNWSYRISQNRGETWGNEYEILTGWKSDTTIEHGYYLTAQLSVDPKGLSEMGIHLGFVGYDEDFQSAPHRHNVYYIYYSIDADDWYNAAGTPLTLPLSRATLDTSCQVLDSGTNYTNHARAGADASGPPNKLYVAYITDTGAANAHEHKCAYYDAGWHIVTAGTGNAPGNWDASNALNIISSTSAELYEVLDVSGSWEIHRYISVNGGVDWTKDKEISTGQDGNCVQLVRNIRDGYSGYTFGGEDDAKVVFCEWTDTTSAEVYLYGDSGFIGDRNMEYEYVLADIDTRDLIQTQPIEVLETDRVLIMADGSKKKMVKGIDYEITIPMHYVENVHEPAWETFIYQLMDWREAIKVFPHIDRQFYNYWVVLENAAEIRRAMHELQETFDVIFITSKLSET